MSVCLWDVPTARAACKPLKGHTNAVFCVDFSPRSGLVASGSLDESVRVWDVRSGKCVKTLAAHSEPVTSARFNSDGTLLLTCSYDGLVRLWDLATFQCLRTLADSVDGFFTSTAPVGRVAFAPNDKFLLAATLDGRIRVWDPLGAKVVRTFVGHANASYCLGAAFTSTSTRTGVVSGSEDGRVCVWDLQPPRPSLVKLAPHSDVPLIEATDAWYFNSGAVAPGGFHPVVTGEGAVSGGGAAAAAVPGAAMVDDDAPAAAPGSNSSSSGGGQLPSCVMACDAHPTRDAVVAGVAGRYAPGAAAAAASSSSSPSSPYVLKIWSDTTSGNGL